MYALHSGQFIVPPTPVQNLAPCRPAGSPPAVDRARLLGWMIGPEAVDRSRAEAVGPRARRLLGGARA